jgi:hypothetical protein
MPSAVLILTLIALATHLYGAGGSVDRVVVHLPARNRIGPLAYVQYARATDLGRGRVWYPVMNAIGGIALLAALGLALLLHASTRVTVALAVATVLALFVRMTTRVAAPTMLRAGRAGDDEAQVKPLLDRFARVSALRMTGLVLTSAALLSALLLR